jgi:hypothetical protein
VIDVVDQQLLAVRSKAKQTVNRKGKFDGVDHLEILFPGSTEIIGIASYLMHNEVNGTGQLMPPKLISRESVQTFHPSHHQPSK